MPLIDSRLTDEAELVFLTTEDELDYIIGDLFGTITEAAWDQSATWDATAGETFAVTATFAQEATWNATAALLLSGSATWGQDTAWDAVMVNGTDILPDLQPASGFAGVIRTNRIEGTFDQSAQWAARVRVNDDDLVMALV